jgi:hypothetical protein
MYHTQMNVINKESYVTRKKKRKKLFHDRIIIEE